MPNEVNRTTFDSEDTFYVHNVVSKVYDLLILKCDRIAL